MKFKLGILLITSLFLSSLEAQNYKFDPVTVEQLSKVKDDIFPEATAMIMYRDVLLIYGNVLRVSERIKIFNKEGFEYSNWETTFEKMKSFKVYIYNLENGMVVKTEVAEENIYKERKDKNTKITKIAFPNVKEGSILEINYEVLYVGVNYINTQALIPTKRLKIAIQNSTLYGLKFRENLLSNVNLELSNNSTVVLFKGFNIKPLKLEDHVGNINNYRGRIFIEQVNTFGGRKIENWEHIAKMYNSYKWFGAELKKRNNFYKDELFKLIGNETNQLKNSKKIYYYLQERMTWNKYYSRGCGDLKDIFNKKSGDTGDINFLLISMFRKAGLKANPALVASKNRGYIMTPTINGFNSIVASVEIDGKVYLLDASRKNAGFGELHEDLMNGNGFVVYEDDTYQFIPTKSSKLSKNTTIVNATIDVDESFIKGNVLSRIDGHFAWDFRDDYENSGNQMFLKNLENSNNSLTASNFIKKNFDNNEKPITYSYDYEYEDYIELINEDVYFTPLLYFGLEENEFKEVDRQYPVDYEYPFSRHYLINYKIPDNYILKNVPQGKIIHLENNVGSLKYNVDSVNNTIQVSLKIEINLSLIPASYYEGLKSLYSEYLSISKSKIVLSKKVK